MIKPPANKVSSRSWQPFLLTCLIGIALAFLLAAFSKSSDVTGQTPALSGPTSPELVLQTGHSIRVNGVALSRDNRVLASASADNTIRLWDVNSGLELRVLGGHTGWVKCVSFSPDGKLLVSGSNDRTVRLWNVETGVEVGQLSGHSGPIETVSFSDDGRFLVSGSADKTAKLWENSSWRELRTLTGHSDWVTVATFSADGKWLATVSKPNQIHLWNLIDNKPARLLNTNTDRVRALSFSADSQFFATGSLDRTLKIWKTSNGKEVKSWKGSGSTISLGFSDDGRELLSISNNRALTVWDINSARPVRSVGDTKSIDFAETIAISHDKQWFASSADRAVEFYNSATGQKVRTFDSRAAGFYAVALSQDGHWLASGCKDTTVRLWDTITGRQLPALIGHSGYVTSISFSKDGRSLVSASLDRTIRLWDTATGEERRKLSGHQDTIGAVTFSHDGQLIASGSLDRTVKVWNATEGREIRTLAGHSGEVTSVAFSANGRWLASGSVDKTIRLWDTTTWEEARILDLTQRVNAIALNPESTLLAVGSTDMPIRLIELSSGREVHATKRQPGEIRALSFSRDGSRLLTGSTDQVIRIWRVATMSEPQVLPGHAGSVNAVAFSNDGKWLASASEDGTVVIWDAETQKKLATLISFRDGANWLVATSDGLFDGSPGSWNQILWRFSGSTFNIAPAEAFFNEFYYPGLLAEILGGNRPKPPVDIALKDRRQPRINLTSEKSTNKTAITTRQAVVRLDMSEAKSDGSHPSGSGIRDVRLFRNGSLVKVWRGEVALDGAGKAVLETSVSLVAGKNDLTAYAFNRDNIKSTDVTLSLVGDGQLKRRGTLFILNVGINQYANSEYNLRYAVPDAEDFGAELKRSQLRLGTFERVEVIPLLDQLATKLNIMQALTRLAPVNDDLSPGAPEILKRIGRAQPEDAVIIYFAGHGVAPNDGHFYLVPHDLGYKGLRTALDATSRQQILDHSISDLELEEALEGIDAGQFLLVIDACNSGQALEADEKRRGPMNAKGLAQLAYEKGMHILTAAQSYQVALEQRGLGHGYLTYALVEEGLRTQAADLKPRDGDVTLPEWLDYAVSRVPQMQVGDTKNDQGRLLEHEEIRRKKKERDVQRPRVFYRFGIENKPLIIARLGSA